METDNQRRRALLSRPIQHIDATAFDGRAVIDAYRQAAFQARNLAEAADIVDEMLADRECAVILTLAGSLVSAGLKKTLLTLVECNMVDAIVATGAIVVDQDFFEALDFRHYMAPGSPSAPTVTDEELRELGIDRIYDTWISEADLQECDEQVARILDGLERRPWSSREIVREMGAWLDRNRPDAGSLVLAAYRREIPVFVPALSDSSAGFGVVMHRARAAGMGIAPVAFDSGKDFHELARLKRACAATGLLMVGGGVPKNFAQDAVVAARILAEPVHARGVQSRDAQNRDAQDRDAQNWGNEGDRPFPASISMHKYAVQLTVADERDGGLSGSTLREATTWGKVETTRERMVFGEATVTLPILVSDAWHRGRWRRRRAMRLGSILDAQPAARPAWTSSNSI